MDIESILAQTVPCPDLLLFEGFRRDAGRKILVLGPRCDVHDPRFAAVRSNAVAVVYRDRDAPGLGVPEFEAKRLPELCAWIERNAGLKR